MTKVVETSWLSCLIYRLKTFSNSIYIIQENPQLTPASKLIPDITFKNTQNIAFQLGSHYTRLNSN